MKKILLIISYIALCNGAFAQNRVEFAFGSGSFRHTTDVVECAPNVSITYSYGFPISPSLSVGAGAGTRFYVGTGFAPPGANRKPIFIKEYYRELAIPAFCFVRYNLQTKQVSPFIGTKVGFVVPVGVWEPGFETDIVYRGGFVEPEIGVSFGGSDKQCFSVGLAAVLQNRRNTAEEKSYLSTGLKLFLGYSF